jgi:hypothetical protein
LRLVVLVAVIEPKLPELAYSLVDVLFVKIPVLAVVAPIAILLIEPPVRVAFDDEKELAVTEPLRTLAPVTIRDASVVEESVVVARDEVPVTVKRNNGVVVPIPTLPAKVDVAENVAVLVAAILPKLAMPA